MIQKFTYHPLKLCYEVLEKKNQEKITRPTERMDACSTTRPSAYVLSPGHIYLVMIYSLVGAAYPGLRLLFNGQP